MCIKWIRKQARNQHRFAVNHGLVERIQYSEIPPHVEYGLTAQGKKLVPALVALRGWAEEQVKFEKAIKK
ncbi:MAG TPA: hypothetical protein DDW65_25305 [Firmicutes bacterium]|nr:hypothetical protein [Bacillota bacterium]